MRKFLIAALLALSAVCNLHAADIPVFPTGPVFRVTGLVWGTTGPTGFNNNFFFTPLSQNESVCVYVRNNNPTNSHTFAAAIAINSDPANLTPSDATWQNAANSSGLTVAASPGVNTSIAAQVSGVAQVSIDFSASVTQAGSPDTANVTIIQSVGGTCFSGNNAISSAPTTVSANPSIQAISDGLSQAFYTGAIFTNPLIGSTVVIDTNSGTKTAYMSDVTISCTAQCSWFIDAVSTNGTCSSTPTTNLKINSPVLPQTLATSSATGSCAATVISHITRLDVAANAPFTFDLKGTILTAGGTNGVQANLVAAVTGVTTITFRWHEK